MKRIFAWLLTALLLVSCVGCIRISCSMPVRYANADRYTAGDFTYEETKVKKVEIDWASGGITLKNGKGTLSVSESGAENLKEEEKLHWWIDGTTLRIKYCKSGQKLSLTEIAKKELTVELPMFVDLDIEIASGKVFSEGRLDVGAFDLKTASGGAEIGELYAEEVDIDNASGGILLDHVEVSGAFKVDSASGGLSVGEIAASSIRINSASGGITIGIGTVEKVNLNSTSGSIKLTLLDKTAGAKVRYSAVSGNFNTSLSVVNSGELMTFGNGYTDMEISIVSGSVTID